LSITVSRYTGYPVGFFEWSNGQVGFCTADVGLGYEWDRVGLLWGGLESFGEGWNPTEKPASYLSSQTVQKPIQPYMKVQMLLDGTGIGSSLL